jgi:hypothetical protein
VVAVIIASGSLILYLLLNSPSISAIEKSRVIISKLKTKPLIVILSSSVNLGQLSISTITIVGAKILFVQQSIFLRFLRSNFFY